MYNDNLYFDDLEKEYFSKYSTYNIEKSIIETFSKNDFMNFINDLKLSINQIDYRYKKMLFEKIKSYNQFNLKEMDKYFIETFTYYFNGGEEIAILKDSLSRLKFYFNLNYSSNYNYKKIDILSIPIEKIIGMYMELPNNLNRNFKCPLHNDKTPSFKIYKNTNSYYCFGCLKGGNIINFISHIENISTKEAYKKILNINN